MASHSRRTLTFLFTDIESSTERWQRGPDEMAVALRRHDALLADVVESNGGRIFKHMGDGVCAVFESAGDAVAAAAQAQAALRLPARMGLHTGEAEARDGDFFGPTLNRCARIMDAGHGGQVLLSEATLGLLSSAVSTDLGEHLLKGLDQPERIHQLGTRAFPDLRTARRAPALPQPTTSLVGRDALVAEVVDRVTSTRVVTLTGLGGVGKTRLAVAAADRLATSYAVVVFVDLSEVHDDAEATSALARALDVPSPSIESISVALSGRPALVVLDNCEHVLDAAADLVEAVLGASRRVDVLATSREGLAIDGEHIIAVPCLDVGGTESSAVDLFLERARSRDNLVTPTSEETATIGEVCRHLDGLPLAIELAAARTNVLAPRELLDRLDERFRLLTGGRRRRSRDRQRTLRETVDWSYDLLAEDEQEVFARLSVFATSFGADSAAAVLPNRSELDVLDVLEALIDKSLLMSIDVEGLRRYRYLETIRSYAEERLDQQEGEASMVTLLGGHLAAVVSGCVDDIFNGSGLGAARLRVEIPNIRRCFDDALDRADHELATSLIGPMAELIGAVDWRISGWTDEVLALPGVGGTPSEPELLAVQTVDHWLGRRFDLLHADADRMLDRAEASGSVSDVVDQVASMAYRMTGDDDETRRMLRARLDRLRAQDGGRALFAGLSLAWLELTPPHPGASSGVLEPELEHIVASATDHSSSIVRGLAALVAGTRACAVGDFEVALERARSAADLSITASGHWFAALQLRAIAEFGLGRVADALRTADRDLDEAYRIGDRSATIIPVTIYALALRDAGEVDAVATLRGFLPRRMTLMLIAEHAELGRWLDERCPADRRAELAALGARMSARELQQLAHTTLASHIETERP